MENTVEDFQQLIQNVIFIGGQLVAEAGQPSHGYPIISDETRFVNCQTQLGL